MLVSPVETKSDVGELSAWLTVTLPMKIPEEAGVSVRVNVLMGCRADTTPVEKGRESLSDDARTWTEPTPVRFGSFTVTVRASLHSNSEVRSTERVAHCCPAGCPACPKRWHAGVCGGTNAPSSSGCL